ncbi:MAG: TolC family protein [Bacteriovoracaceae bacterium]|nr:TolC family protein [Bacteriovoracaceae bacterium]
MNFATAQVVNIGDYLAYYLVASNKIVSAHLQYLTGQANYTIAQDRYKTDFSVTPSLNLSHSKVDPLNNLKFTKLNLSTSIVQQMPLGVKISLLNDFSIDESGPYSGEEKDFTQEINIEIPLLKNRLSKMDHLYELYSKWLMNSKLETSNFQKFDECRSGILNYLKAYNAQEITSIFQDVKNKARIIWLEAQRNYQKRIISKLNYLSAKADWPNVRFRAATFLNTHHTTLNLIKQYLPNSSKLELESPIAQLELLPSLSPKLEMAKQYKSLKATLSSSEALYDYTKEKLKNSFNFITKLGSTNTINDVLYSGNNDSHQHYIYVGFDVSLSIFNNTDNYEISSVFYQKEMAQHDLSTFGREFKKEVSDTMATIAYLEDAIALTDEKITVNQLRAKEAHKLMKIGKINFEDYIDYRDQALNEKINKYDLIYRLYEQKLDLITKGDSLPTICN